MSGGRMALQENINGDDSTEIEKYASSICVRNKLVSVDEVRLELFLKKYKPKENKLIISSINVIQAEREYNEVDIDKDEGITF